MSFVRKAVALLVATTVAISPAKAIAAPSEFGASSLSSTVGSSSPAEDEESVDVSRLNNDLNSVDAGFQFQSIVGRANEFDIVLTYDNVTFKQDPQTGAVIAVNPDGTEEVFSDNAIQAPVGPGFETTAEIVSENTIAISATQTGYMPRANPYNMFGCVQNVLTSASLLATILGTTAVVAQALAAAGAAVAMAAAALYCSTI